jgi:hypothetical protein
MLRGLLLVSLVPVIAAGQSATPLSVAAAPQSLTNVAPQPRADQIEFVKFEFQEPHLYELSVHYGPIDGEPSAGLEYGAEAVIGGEEAIASATLHVVDEMGRKIQPVPIATHSTGGSFEFLGLMTVPSQPFRILLEGESVDGKAFKRAYPRLFRPVNEPQARLPRFPPDFPRELVAGFQQMFDHLAPKTIAERQALVAGNPDGKIVIPRFQVSNVTYAPLLAPGGRPVGLRMSYDVEFSTAGRYRPELRVFAEDKEDFIVGRNPLHPLESTIVPRPRKAHSPDEEAEYVPGLLAQLTDYIYEAGTHYRFTLELLPNFIVLDRDKTTLCVIHQRFRLERDPARAFARMVANEGPTTYRVSIGGNAFEARIANFYGEGTFYRNFVAEGGRDCADQGR